MKLKKIIISSIAFCSLMTIGNVSATITSTQLEQIIPTSDLKFHNCVLDTYNSNYNSSEDHATIEQIKTNLSNITELSCESRQISSIEGIQFLTGLEKLNLSDNNIFSINLSNNINLKELNISKNDLKKIDLSKNVKLKVLNLQQTSLKAIDLSKNVNLITLNLAQTKFSVESSTVTDIREIAVGEKTKFKEYIVTPSNIKQKLRYKSSNPEVATVDENGNISAIKEGTTTIVLISDIDGTSATSYEKNRIKITKKDVQTNLSIGSTSNENSEVTFSEQKSVENPKTSDKGLIYGGGFILTAATIIAVRKKIKMLGI